MDVNYAVCEYIERMAEAVPGMKAMLLDDETVRCESGPGKCTALLGARARLLVAVPCCDCFGSPRTPHVWGERASNTAAASYPEGAQVLFQRIYPPASPYGIADSRC